MIFSINFPKLQSHFVVKKISMCEAEIPLESSTVNREKMTWIRRNWRSAKRSRSSKWLPAAECPRHSRCRSPRPGPACQAWESDPGWPDRVPRFVWYWLCRRRCSRWKWRTWPAPSLCWGRAGEEKTARNRSVHEAHSPGDGQMRRWMRRRRKCRAVQPILRKAKCIYS